MIGTPLRDLALCLNCETTFDLHGRACPACGSESFVLVARLLNADNTACSWRTRTGGERRALVDANRMENRSRRHGIEHRHGQDKNGEPRCHS